MLSSIYLLLLRYKFSVIKRALFCLVTKKVEPGLRKLIKTRCKGACTQACPELRGPKAADEWSRPVGWELGLLTTFKFSQCQSPIAESCCDCKGNFLV